MRLSALSYISVSTPAVIGQFNAPYSTEQPTKLIKAGFVVKMIRDLSPSVLTFHDKKKFKTFVYFKLCIRRANHLQRFRIAMTRFAFNRRQLFEILPNE